MLQSCSPKNAKLVSIVDRFWCVSDKTADGYETVLPSGKAQIIFSLSDIPLTTFDPDNGVKETHAREIFQGPTSQPRRISRKPQKSLCGVSFCPGGAGALLAHIDKTADRVINLSHFWGVQAAQIGEALRTFNSDRARFDLLEDEIAKRISDTSEIVFLRQGLEHLRVGLSLDQACEVLGCTPYTFRKVFLKNVGFTPKRYLRIERFRAAAENLTLAASLADIAAFACFSDQSHMTREIDHFAKMTPSRLRSSDRPHLGHVLED